MLHKDENDIIGQIQPDGSIEGGDSATWMGHYIYLTDSKFPYVTTFEVAPGAYVRHPKPKQTNNGFGAHYKNPWNGCISRDQLTGIIAALIKQKERKALLRAIVHHSLRGFLFSYNTIYNGRSPSEYRFNIVKLFYNLNKESYYKIPDITGPNIWAMYLRGFGLLSWLFWPLLCILDLQLVVDTHLTNTQDDSDQINYTIRMLVAKDHVPTPISLLARKMLNKEDLLDHLESYWCGWRRNCDMYDLYESKVKEL